MTSETKLRNVTLTHFGDTFDVTDPRIMYAVWQKEACPDTGRLHFQAYVQFKTQIRFNSILKLWPGCHVETSRGSDDDNHHYCTKEHSRVEGPWEVGTRKQQGRRSDIEAAVNIAITEGIEAVADQAPIAFVKYGRGLKDLVDTRLRATLPKWRTWMTTCDWLYGPTEAGKSHYAFADQYPYDPATHYDWQLEDHGWQDGYKGQPIVLINDFRGEIKYNTLLKLIDKWPMSLPRRNIGPIQFLAKHIIITSSLSPESVYCNRNEEDSLEQLLRRINVRKLPKRVRSEPENKNVAD